MCLQANLALCCKAMLPILCMGHVRVRLDEPDGGMPLTQLTRCLTKQPDGVSHLDLFTDEYLRGTRKLIDLRCAHTVQACLQCAWFRMCLPFAVPMPPYMGWGPVMVLVCADAGCCQTYARCPWRLLLSTCRPCSRSPRIE